MYTTLFFFRKKKGSGDGAFKRGKERRKEKKMYFQAGQPAVLPDNFTLPSTCIQIETRT